MIASSLDSLTSSTTLIPTEDGPSQVQSFLQAHGLDQYTECFLENGFDTVSSVSLIIVFYYILFIQDANRFVKLAIRHLRRRSRNTRRKTRTSPKTSTTYRFGKRHRRHRTLTAFRNGRSYGPYFVIVVFIFLFNGCCCCRGCGGGHGG
jgi:hypothetical protein